MPPVVPFGTMQLSTRRMFEWLVLLLLFALAVRPIVIPDFWWHLRTGQLVVESGSIPHSDPFSFTSEGKEWVTNAWLSQVVMYLSYRVAGWGGPIVLFAALITAAFGMVWRRMAGRPYVAGAALFLGAFSTAPHWGVNSQALSIVLASAFLVLLDGYTRDGKVRQLSWMPLLMVLWVNLHPAYLLGPALCLLVGAGLALDELAEERGWRAAGRRMAPLALAALACLAVVPLNPNGVRMFSYPFETLGSKAIAENLRDWLPPNFHNEGMIPFALLIFATLAALAVSPRRSRLSEAFLLAATGLAALRSARHIPIFALVATPLLAEHAWAWLRTRSWGRLAEVVDEPPGRAKSAMNAGMLAVVALVTLMRVGEVVAAQPASEAEVFPRAAVEFLRRQPQPQPLFNDYNWGGYVIWHLYPQYRNYIDGRSDLHGDALMNEYFDAARGTPRWRQSLEHFQVRSALVEPEAPIAALLDQDPGWKKVYQDQQAAIFVRREWR
ncbi:MAG: hypothetical protein ACRD2R_00040 [Terriglobales bacterium]